LKESSDGGTLIAADTWFQIWWTAENAIRPKSVLPWALRRETDWRNTANDWVDGKIWGCRLL